MKFSIITPSFNQGHFIKETIDSILSQDYPDLEHIVMDGGSTDSTVEVLQAYDDPRLKWVSEPDKGQSDAINKGMARAEGELLAYLNSDDIYYPGALAAVAAAFERQPEVDLVHGNCVVIDGDSRPMRTLKGTSYTLKDALTKRWSIPQPATFWRRRVMESIGPFDETLHFTMDYDYWLRAVLAGLRPHYLDRDLAGFRLYGESKSGSQLDKFWQDWQNLLEKVYSRDDLPPEVSAMRPLSHAFIDLRAAERHWEADDRPGARPYLRRVMGGGGSLSIKALAATMMLDSYLGTPFNQALRGLYRLTRGERGNSP